MVPIRGHRTILRKCLAISPVCRKMTDLLAIKDSSQLLPPPEVKGMKKLDREKFSKHIVVPWLEIQEKNVGNVMNILKKYTLKILKFKPLRSAYELIDGEEILSPCESVIKGSTKRVILNPCLVSSFDDFTQEDREKLREFGVSEDFRSSKIVIGYDNWKADTILKAVLPGEGLKSYSLIGHIVHVNLRDQFLPFKEIIGEILLDKINEAKTVVNKTDIIDSTYRNFQMEILCGSNQMLTRTRENGCIYDLDFSKVYWNPRLCTEHLRIISKLQSGDVVYDIFAGIGPFSLPAGKKRCLVLANDLNPESYKWLCVNCKNNKVLSCVKAYNKDGRVFIEEDVKKDLVERLMSDSLGKSSIHIIMNLPASAVTFLSAFHGLLSNVKEIEKLKCPVVHVYCFVNGKNCDEAAKTLVEEHLGTKLDENLLEVFFVRNVAPNKEMMRVSFKLPIFILAKTNDQEVKSCVVSDEEPNAKKSRLS